MLANFSLLFRFLWQPASAVRALRERAPVAFAVAVAWFAMLLYMISASSLFRYAQDRWNQENYPGRMEIGASGAAGSLLFETLASSAMAAALTVLFVAAIYTPFAILLANLFERRASFSLVVREEYAPVVSCSLLALTASLLVTLPPALLIGWQSAWLRSDSLIGYLALLFFMPFPIFAALMTIILGISFRIGWAAAAATTLISFLSLLGAPLLMQAATFICASPLLLLLLVFLLRDKINDAIGATRSKQAFKQNLEAATLNPADASAHYQLGLIYQKRGERDAAARSFQRAIEIDPTEVDAHYQLGRIARQQGALNEAIQHFERVVQLDPTHSQHEIWRETALVYYDAGQYSDAIQMLDKFLDKRPSDAEARYWRGMTLYNLNRENEAMREMQSCVESVRVAPAYKYRADRRWMDLAQNFLNDRR
jgi:tetratricopeptide (TPR) repeat protein